LVSARPLEEVQAVDAAEIFERAAARSREHGLRYAGAVTPGEAWKLAQAGEAALVDVRTPHELETVGRIEDVPLVEWPRDGGDEAIDRFVGELRARLDPAKPVLFICRTGVRSHYAAHVASAVGFPRAYNVLEGFEGHPGAGDGWREAGLPWTR
jgi:rhodanese-related sulfurtransferase